MAEKVALKKLEDHLNCPICLDTYTDPKQLLCHHVYCKKCLAKLVFRDQQGQLILTCPSCRQVTPVSPSGVAGLQPAFQINQFLEIVEEHKKARNATEKRSISTSLSPHGNTAICCTEHNGREVELYCDTCKKPICYKCIKKGEKHHSHNYEELDTAFTRYRENITSFLEPMEKKLATIKRVLSQLDVHYEEISNQQATVEANIHNTVARLHQTLDDRKTELINELYRLTQAKLKSLAVQRDQIEAILVQVRSCLHSMRENLKTGNKEEAMLMKSITVRQVKELAAPFHPDLLEPNTEVDMTFSALEDIVAVIQTYGKVYNKSSPDPFKCIASGKEKVVVVGEKSTAFLQTLNSDGLPSKESLDSIMCELVSDMTGTRVRGCMKRRRQSQYVIGYQPTIKGRHQLHIKVEGQHIRGSPFSINVKSPVEKLGTPILTIHGLKVPEGVAVNQRGEVVVTERGPGRVSVFSLNGEKIHSFGTRGNGQGQFKTPYGVAVDSKGCILVTDKDNHCIQKFTSEGRFLTTVGTEGDGPLQFNYPKGIAYNSSNGRVYVGDKSCRVQILYSDLSYAGSFGKRGSGKGQLNYPQHLACDSTGNVYVSDYSNYRIQVFTADGKFLRMFGRHGSGKRELSGPTGLAIDSSDRVYVSEWDNHRVSVFTPEGQFVTSFGRQGNGPGQLGNPAGLAVDSSGVVYVCEYHNCRVQLF